MTLSNNIVTNSRYLFDKEHVIIDRERCKLHNHIDFKFLYLFIFCIIVNTHICNIYDIRLFAVSLYSNLIDIKMLNRSY